MSFTRLVLAAFIGSLLASVFALAWSSSRQTGKGIPASLPDVPSEARRLASDVRTKATDVINKRRGAASEEESAFESTLEESVESAEEALGI